MGFPFLPLDISKRFAKTVVFFMTGYELYIFFLCLIVFVSLTALLTALLYILLKQGHKLIFHGIEDERIKAEYIKRQKESSLLRVVSTFLTLVILGAVLAAFSISVYLQVTEKTHVAGIPMPKVVMSPSMEKVHDNNTYVEKNGLTDQIAMFDLILVQEMPDEFDLKLYDIVVYEDSEGNMIIHRIIQIYEPSSDNPDQRGFVLRGDANLHSDERVVTYDQMRGIYKGERIPYVGSFFAFMQSPAGYLCILLIIIAVIAAPIMEKKLWEAKLNRLKVIGFGPFAWSRPKKKCRFWTWMRAIFLFGAFVAVPAVENRLWKQTLGRTRAVRMLGNKTKKVYRTYRTYKT